MRKEKIIVTGGAGFIGSHLVKELVNQGYQVTVVDNLIHGDKKRLSPDVGFISLDIRDKGLIRTFRKTSATFVYHLAAQQDVGKANNDPQYDASVNILGTLNVLECCRKTGVKRIIYADSVAGFGEPKKLPVSADHPRNPYSFYGISKHTVEHYLEVYRRYHGLDFVSLVLANVYGPRQDPFGEGGVVAIFSHRMAHNKTVFIDGDGEQTRDFIYVGDVVAAFLKAQSSGANEFHMVGTGRKTKVNELFRLMKIMSGYNKRVVHRRSRVGDVKDSVFSIAETRQALQWTSVVSLEEGLRQTLVYFRESIGVRPIVSR